MKDDSTVKESKPKDDNKLLVVAFIYHGLVRSSRRSAKVLAYNRPYPSRGDGPTIGPAQNTTYRAVRNRHVAMWHFGAREKARRC